MARPPSTHPELDRYLLDGERLVTAVHQHWGKVAEPVLSALAGGALALWVDATIPPALGLLSTLLWWAWFAVLARAAYEIAEWRHDWFVATDKRLLLFYGRVLGYGRFVMESAGQDQALREVNWVPDPDHHYRAICAEIFRVADRIRLSEPLGGEGAVVPEPYAGWDDPRYGADRSTAIPIRPAPDGDAPDGSLYRSPDLREGPASDREADTGPISYRLPRPRRGNRDR